MQTKHYWTKKDKKFIQCLFWRGTIAWIAAYVLISITAIIIK